MVVARHRSVVLAIVASSSVVASLIARRPTPLGAGRVLSAVLVGSWASRRSSSRVHRPREPLAALMAVGAMVGAVALLGAALRRA